MFGVCVNLILITNSLIGLRNCVMRQLALLNDSRHDGFEPWQVLQSVTGTTDEGDVRFTPEEMAVFVSADHIDFAMDALLLAQRHASTIATFREYCERRKEMGGLMPPPVAVDGVVASGEMTTEEFRALLPRMIQLNSIVKQLVPGFAQDIALGRGVVERFGSISKALFPGQRTQAITFPSDETLAEKIAPKEPNAVRSC